MPIKIVAPSIELMSKAKLVVEGRARLRVPVARKPKTTNPAFEADVFYNPEMERNRSVSVEVLKAYQKKTRRDLRIADVFSGSGVRGIRYALEVPRVSLTAFNDLDAKALKLSRENARRSGVPARKAEFSQEDANVFLSTHSR
ncbi:MAG TPA: methyltransferase, partial [archaeon]|nr:methyltransferase [archaeon]